VSLPASRAAVLTQLLLLLQPEVPDPLGSPFRPLPAPRWVIARRAALRRFYSLYAIRQLL